VVGQDDAQRIEDEARGQRALRGGEVGHEGRRRRAGGAVADLGEGPEPPPPREGGSPASSSSQESASVTRAT